MDLAMSEKYYGEFLRRNMMGPNSIVILEELLESTALKEGMRVLDLGCGNGLTSIFLAREYGVQVFAVDLWIPAADNFLRFQEWGVDGLVIPLHADASELPFAKGYFDAVVSVDAYHYFGNNNIFFPEKLKPFLKENAAVAIAVPGMRREIKGGIPEEMKPYWTDEALDMWHSIDWWRPKFAEELAGLRLWQMECFQKAWGDWFAAENPYARADRAMLQADRGRFMNLIGITGCLKPVL